MGSPTLLILVLIVVLAFAQNYQFYRFKEEMEEKVKWLQGNLSLAYANRCQNPLMTNCEVKSYNFCNGTGQRTCIQNFPTPQSCFPTGMYLARQGLRFSNQIDLNNLENNAKQFACVSATINQTFTDILVDNRQRHSFVFIGSPTGGIRLQPSFGNFDENQCLAYDPRTRPWYSSAISGSKNIIIFVDVSYSMKQLRLPKAIAAANSTIQTMGTYDSVAVITFSSEANVLGRFSELKTVNDENKRLLQQQIGKIQASKKDNLTNYEKAFQKGFQIFKNSINAEKSCMQDLIFLFITDGQPTQGFQTFEELSTLIDQNMEQLSANLTFISFSIGSPEIINSTLLNQLSCKYGGYLEELQDVTDNTIVEKIQNYYDFLFQTGHNSTAFWTEPYIDAFGLGQIVTVSVPIFQQTKDENNLTKIIGVAGIDVLMSQLTKFSLDKQNVILELGRQKSCYSRARISQCQRQAARLNLIRNTSVCSSDCNVSLVQTCEYSNEIFQKAIDESFDSQRCCGLIPGGLIGVVLAIAVVLGVIVVLLVWFLKGRRLEKEQLQKMHPQKFKDNKVENSQLDNIAVNPNCDLYEMAKSKIKIYQEGPIDYYD